MTDSSDSAQKITTSLGAVPRSTWPFGGDVVVQATKELPEDHRNAVRWLFHHAIENNLTMADAAEAIRFDKTTIYRIMKGEYGAKLDRVVEAILTYKRIVDERGLITTGQFIETSISKKIWKICDSAVIYNAIAYVFGDSQIGKTTAIEEYQRRHNHGQTKLFRMPASAGIQLMAKEFAASCALSRHSSFENTRDSILKAVDSNHLVIADELHQVFLSYQKGSAMKCLEFLREVHDRTGCAMVLVGTRVLREEIQRGVHKEMLEQIRRRGIFELQLPAVPPKRDLDAIAASFGLPASEGEAQALVDDIIKSSGLGKYVKFLKAASRHANKRRGQITWADFITAHDIILKLSKGTD